MPEVTDPGLLDQLNAAPSRGGQEVTDPKLLEQLNAPSHTAAETGWDVAKQVATKPIAGVEAIASGPAKLLGLAGRGLEYLAPGLSDPEAVKEREQLQKLIAEQGGDKGISQYLPKAETRWGKLAGSAAEMLPAGLVQPGSLLRRGAEAAAAGAASEGAGQLTEGTELEPYARVAGAIIGGYPVAKTAQIAQDLRRSAAAPTIENLGSASDKAYKAARKLNVPYDPDAASNLQRGINQSLLQDGFRPGGGMSTFERVAELTHEGGIPPRFSDIESVRRALGRLAGDKNPHPPFGPSENAVAARRAIDHIDEFLKNPANAMPGFEDAAKLTANLAEVGRGNWAAKSRAQTISNAVETGELGAGATGSGANIDNRLRQQARNILTNPRRLRGYSVEDRAVLREIATGSVGRNIARYVGKLAPTGIVSAAGLEYLAQSLGLPGVGHAITAGGAYAGKKAADWGTRLAYKRLGTSLRADSPLGRSMDIPAPAIAPNLQAALLRGEIAAQEEQQGGRVEEEDSGPSLKNYLRDYGYNPATMNPWDLVNRAARAVSGDLLFPGERLEAYRRSKEAKGRQRGGAVKISSRTGTHTIPVEIASTPAQQARGLSGRRTLGKGRGMLFDLSSVRPTSFWMNNTHIPLDMIFIRADGRIAKIAENRKPLSRERVLSDGPVAKVLEVAAGTARRLRLMPGDRVA